MSNSNCPPLGDIYNEYKYVKNQWDMRRGATVFGCPNTPIPSFTDNIVPPVPATSGQSNLFGSFYPGTPPTNCNSINSWYLTGLQNLLTEYNNQIKFCTADWYEGCGNAYLNKQDCLNQCQNSFIGDPDGYATCKPIDGPGSYPIVLSSSLSQATPTNNSTNLWVWILLIVLIIILLWVIFRKQ